MLNTKFFSNKLTSCLLNVHMREKERGREEECCEHMWDLVGDRFLFRGEFKGGWGE